jgi:hypothetical protein
MRPRCPGENGALPHLAPDERCGKSGDNGDGCKHAAHDQAGG